MLVNSLQERKSYLSFMAITISIFLIKISKLINKDTATLVDKNNSVVFKKNVFGDMTIHARIPNSSNHTIYSAKEFILSGEYLRLNDKEKDLLMVEIADTIQEHVDYKIVKSAYNHCFDVYCGDVLQIENCNCFTLLKDKEIINQLSNSDYHKLISEASNYKPVHIAKKLHLVKK
jgi:hypothetical protein